MVFRLLLIFVLVPLFLLSLLVSAIVILASGKGKRRAASRTILLMYAVGFGLLVLAVIALSIVNTIYSPMGVDRDDVIGTYRVDREMFSGRQADWQHEHFRLTITEDDTVVLESLDSNGSWHVFKREITPVQGVNSYLWRFPNEGDSTVHHILAHTPTLHRQQWGFYYSFRSPRFGNVFFRKE